MINNTVVIAATRTIPATAAIHGLRSAVAWIFSMNPVVRRLRVPSARYR